MGKKLKTKSILACAVLASVLAGGFGLGVSRAEAAEETPKFKYKVDDGEEQTWDGQSNLTLDKLGDGTGTKLEVWGEGATSNSNIFGCYDSVTINGRTIIFNSGIVHEIRGGVSTSGDASDNIVNINGGEVSDKVVGGNVLSGNGNANNNVVNIDHGNVYMVFGGESNDSGNVNDNSVKIINGSVGSVRAGRSSYSGNVSCNRVEISGGTVSGYIYGGESSSGNASGNRVDISGGTFTGNFIYGGYSKSGTVSGNRVEISGGMVGSTEKSQQIYGGRSLSGNITVDTDKVIEISGNIVEISGGTISGYVYGGSSPSGNITVDTNKVIEIRGNIVEISGNIVEISGGAVTGNIYGGYGNITVDIDKVIEISGNIVEIGGNIVEISGGAVTGNIYGSYITSGTVSGNTVKISDGTVNGNIYGGESVNGDATGNSVTINGGIFNGASLYGGVAGGGKTSSGNILNVNTAINGNFVEVSDFQVMNFSVPAYYANSQDQSTVYQMLNVTAEGATSFDFRDVDIKVTNAPYLAAGDYITLIRGVNGTTFSLKDNIHYQVLQFPNYVELVYANGTPMPGTDYIVIQKDGNVLKQYYSDYGDNTYDSVVGNMNMGGLNTASYSNNEVVINKGTYTQSISGASASNNTAVTDNKVSVHGGTVSGAVYGGQSSSGNVSGNRVEINGGTISGGVYGGQSSSGDAIYNRVEINSGTVSGAVYGGQSTSGNISGNKVEISGGAFNGASLYGGVTTGISSSNTLFLNTAVNGTVNTVDNFQNIHFTVPSGLASGTPMLSVSTSMSLAGVVLVTDTGVLSLNDGQTITLIQGVSETGFVPNVHYTVDKGNLIYKHIDETKDKVHDYTIRQWDKEYNSGNAGTYSDVRTEHYTGLLIQGNTTDGDLSNTRYSGNEVIIRKGTYNGIVNGAYYDTGTFDITNNKVSVYGGTVTDRVCGGLSSYGTGDFSGNIVNIFDGTIGSVCGFYANNGTGDASDNVVNISGGEVKADVFGAWIMYGTAHNNMVKVTGGTVGRIYGGSGNHAGDIDVTDNLVIISDGTVSGNIYGGWEQYGKISGNRVEISGGMVGSTEKSQQIYGGSSPSGNVSNNIVEISGGMVGSTEKSQQIYGGQSDSGTVSGNRVEISGGTVSGTVYGGYSISGNISGNTVKVSGGNLSNATLYGWGGTISESHSNNVLQIENPVAVSGIGNFDSINLVLPENVADNTKILTMSNAVDLSGVAVNVYLNGQEPDTITLIDKVENSGTYNIWVGTDNSAELGDNYTISVDNGSLVLQANVVLWYRVGDEARRFASSSEPRSISDTSGKAVVLHRGAGNANEYTGINITGALTVGGETETGKSFLVSGDLTAGEGVTVATKNTLNVGAGNLNSDVTNNGTVNLGAGTLASGSTITGGTLNITGDVTANAVLSAENMNVEQEATLTISADNLQITNGLINTGKTILTGGTLSCNITTTKQTYSDLEIEGEVLNNAEITQNGIRIKGSGTSFTTDADKIHTGQVDMLGGAVLNLTGGTIDFNITNEENTTAKIVENATVEMSSSGRVGNLQVAGTLDMNGQTNKVTNLDLTATGTLDLKNNACETVVFENLTAAEGATVNFDANLKGTGDQIKVTTTGSGKLALGSIGLSEGLDGDVGSTKIITFLTGETTSIELTGRTETVLDIYKYIFEPGKDAGTLKVTKDNGFSLHEVITNSKTGAGAVSNYSLKENYDVTENLGTLTRDEGAESRTLVINGNNHTFDGKTTNAIGVNDGDTLGFKDVTVQGFSDNVAVNNAGTVELDGVTLKSGITGSGITKIVGNTTLEAKVNQEITVDTGKILTTVADNLGEAVTNGGTVNLGAGTLTIGNTITDGTLNITGDVTANAGDIAGNTNTVAENKTLTFIGGTLNKAITNNGTVKLNGATLGGAYVTGGTLEFAKDMTINADNATADTNIVDSGVTLTVNGGTFDKKLGGSGTLNITGTLHYGTNAELVETSTQDVGGRNIPVSDVNVTIANGGVMDLKDRESTPGGCINTLTFSGGKLDLSGGYVGNLLIAKTLNATAGGSISFDVSADGSDQIGVLTSVASGSNLTLDTINVKGELAGDVAPQSGVSGSIVFAQDLSGQNVLDNLTISGTTTTIAGNYMYTFTSGANGQLNYRKEMGMGIKQVIQAKNIDGSHNDSYAQIATYSFTGERGMNFEPYSKSKIDTLTGDVKTNAENLNKRFGDLGTMERATGATSRTLTIVGNGSELSGGTHAGITVNEGDTLVLKNISAVTDAANNKIATNNGTVMFTGTGGMDVKASVDGTGKLIVDGVNVVLGENYQYVKGRQELTAEELAELKDKTGKTEIEQKEYEFGWKLNSYGSYVTTLSENTSASITQKDLEISSGSLTANANQLAISNGIVNNGEMKFTGGVLNTQVTGTGNLTFDGDVTTNANYIGVSGTNTITDIHTLTLTDGTLVKVISGAGNVVIGDGQHEQSVSSAVGNFTNTGNLTVNAKGTLELIAGTLTKAITNSGMVKLDDVTLKSGITGSGITKIVGNTTLEAKVNQGIIVDTGKTLTTAADNLGGDVTNTGTVNLGAGTLASGSTITGGTLNITGDVIADANDVKGYINTVAANKTLTFNGGTVAGDISGVGKIVVDGNVTSAKNISNFVTVDSGATYTITSGIQSNTVANSGTFNVQGGTVQNYTVNNTTGSTMNVSGGTVQGDIIVASGAVLNIIGGSVKHFDNKGTVNVTKLDALTGFRLYNDNGVINFNADGTLTSGNIIDGGTLNVNANVAANIGDMTAVTTNIAENKALTLTGSGTLNTTLAGRGNVAIGDGANVQTVSADLAKLTNIGTLAVNTQGTLNFTAGSLAKAITNSGTVDMQENSSFGEGGKINGGDVVIGSDVHFKSSNLENVVNLTADGAVYDFSAALGGDNPGVDKIIVTGSATGTLKLGAVTLTSEPTEEKWALGVNKEVQYLDGGTNNSLTVTNETIATSNGYKYTFSQAKDGQNNKIGYLNINRDYGYTLSQIVQNYHDTDNNYYAGNINTYVLMKDYYVGEEIGALTRVETGVARTFTIEGNNYTFGTIGYAGFVVNSGDTLNVRNVSVIADVGGQGDYFVDNAGTVNIVGTTRLTSQVKGNGTTNIGDGSTPTAVTMGEYYGKIVQDNLNITANASLTFDADMLVIANGITNDGTVNLTAGTLKQNIIGGKVVVQGNVTTTADYLNREYEIAADKKLTVNAGTLQYSNLDITGTGKLAVDGTTVLQATTDIFEVTDAIKNSALSITADNIAFAGGILAITGVTRFSLDYYNSITALLKEQGNTSLQMSGAIYVPEGEYSNKEMKVSGDVQFGGDTAPVGSEKRDGNKQIGSLDLNDGTKVALVDTAIALGGADGSEDLIKSSAAEKVEVEVKGTGDKMAVLIIGNEQATADTEYKLDADVKLQSNAVLNVQKGKTEIDGTLNMAGGEVAVAPGAQLTVPTINVTENAQMSGKIATDTLAGASGKVITVGNANAAGHVSAKETKLNGGTLFLDPVWVNGVGIEGATHFATQNTDLDGHYAVGRNSILTIGATNVDADAQFKVSGLKWGEDNVTAAVYVAKNIDVSKIILIVDGNLKEVPTDWGYPNGRLMFRDNSLLMVNGNICKDSAALTKVYGTDIATNSKLFIANAVPNTTYKILTGEDSHNCWLAENVALSGIIDGCQVIGDGTYFNVITGNLKFSTQNTVIPNVGEALVQSGNEQFAQMIDTLPEQQTANVNAYANIGENLGVSRGAYDVANMVGDAIDNHWDSHHEDKDVWAVGTRNKETVDGVELGGMKAQYDAQYNGAVVGVNLSGNFGMAINYTDGKVNNKLGGHNDAEYYGGSLYAKTDWGNLRITADATYTYGKNELSQNGITADAKTETVSGGLTLKYMAKAGLNKIGPFAGIRYMYIKGRDYTDSLGINREADTINSMVVPVGLEYTAEFKMPKSEWTWKPRLAVGYLFNLGDRDNYMVMNYRGVADSFLYDYVDKGAFFANAGMVFEKKNFSLGISYDFMKSKNSKNRRWNVNADVAF